MDVGNFFLCLKCKNEAMTFRVLVVAVSLRASTATPVCDALQQRHLSMGCCGDDETTAVCTAKHVEVNRPGAPTVPGVYNGPKTHVLLAISPDYPPYTNWEGVPKRLTGFNVEFGELMNRHASCQVQIDYILDSWTGCWTHKDTATSAGYLYLDEIREYAGKSLMDGKVHGCTAYTHTRGERELSLEFTHSLLARLKTAGILSRLDTNGVPVVSPTTVNYSNVRLGDVAGWAPTPDTFGLTRNRCVAGHPQFIPPAEFVPMTEDGNRFALESLRNGVIDALYIYADQLHNFINNPEFADLAAGFGTQFAYIHTGLNGWSVNGTTLAISKRGSGLSELLNPCIDAVVRTQEYRDLCTRYFEPSSCIGMATGEELTYDVPMNESIVHAAEDPGQDRTGSEARPPRRIVPPSNVDISRHSATLLQNPLHDDTFTESTRRHFHRIHSTTIFGATLFLAGGPRSEVEYMVFAKTMYFPPMPRKCADAPNRTVNAHKSCQCPHFWHYCAPNGGIWRERHVT